MINPEFTRNLWLEFSMQRLVAMPIVLLIIFLTMGVANAAALADTLHTTAVYLFIAIVWVWGASRATASIAGEFRDNTWDQQRMSAMQPWDMTWGKLLGSTAYNWYGGSFCLLVAGYYGDSPLSLATLEITAIMLHATTFSISLNHARLDARLARQNLVGVFIAVLLIMVLPAIRTLSEQYEIIWWGIHIKQQYFLFATSLLFACTALVAAWRTMRTALQVRSIPWAWPLFALILGSYLGGLLNNAIRDPWHALFATTLWVAVLMTYAGLSSELGNLVAWRRLRLLANAKNWRGWLEGLPTWPGTLVLAFAFALLDTPYPISVHETGEHGLNFGIAPLAVAFMVSRDICIFLSFTVSSSNRRSMAAALVTLLILDVLLPYLLHASGQQQISYLVLPIAPDAPWVNVAVMACQATLALMLLKRRLQSEERIAIAAP